MATALTSPGVYIQEVSSGVHTIVGVATSIGLFIGRSRKGEAYKPIQCLSIEDFNRAFGPDYVGSDLARSVRLFFQNGGTNCYVVRVVDQKKPGGGLAAAAQVQLLTEDNLPSLLLEAKSIGTFGNDIRVAVSYNTSDPEATFNMEVFRWTTTSSGDRVKADAESHLGLSMNADAPNYAQTVLTNKSKLVKATDVAAPAASPGFALAGRPIAARTNTIFRDEAIALFANTARPASQFRVSVDGGPTQVIDLADLDFTVAPLVSVTTIKANLATAIANLINARVNPASVTASFVAGPTGQSGANNASTLLLRIDSANGDVKLYPGPVPADDIAGLLMMGTAQGGIEVSRWAGRRPAPNGTFFKPEYGTGSNYVDFGGIKQADIGTMTVGAKPVPIGNLLATTQIPPPPTNIANPVMFQDRNSTLAAAPPDDKGDGIREKWGIMAAGVQAARALDPKNFLWTAETWGSRLTILPATGADSLTGAVVTTTAGIGGMFGNNVRHYSLGTTGTGAFQTGGVDGKDGGAPSALDYEFIYEVIDREVDIFNLLMLPRDTLHSDAFARSLWGPASIFCQNRRAFLLIDPPDDWDGAQEAANTTVGVQTLRTGLVQDHSAVFFPRLKVPDGGGEVVVGPSGAIAGLMARIDADRGVWKAPAGTEADLRGITGVEKRFSDGENGVMNPKAINVIRVFPDGIVNWGARTMKGDDSFGDEYKYIPIRRLALFIEESLYRGLRWAVFEPNDEPLWAQVRLNVGVFMHQLYRQGAFQGTKPTDAYFVKCDSSTTPQSDRDLGILNVQVGFAPLKPAEFVVLTIQQIVGDLVT